jgi:hypothetical protein
MRAQYLPAAVVRRHGVEEAKEATATVERRQETCFAHK